MKTENDEYNDCLILWESIWTSHIIRKIGPKSKEENDMSDSIDRQLLSADTNAETKTKGGHEKINKSLSTGSLNCIDIPDVRIRNGSAQKRSNSFRVKGSPKETAKSFPKRDLNTFEAKSAEKRLTDAELYTLSICLSIIRRERDLIMAQQLDATEILKVFFVHHFIRSPVHRFRSLFRSNQTDFAFICALISLFCCFEYLLFNSISFAIH